MITINNKFSIGQKVYFVLDPEAQGIICRIYLSPNALLTYAVSWEDKKESMHYDFEISDTKSEKEFSL